MHGLPHNTKACTVESRKCANCSEPVRTFHASCKVVRDRIAIDKPRFTDFEPK